MRYRTAGVNPNATPPATRAAMTRALRAAGWRPGAADELVLFSYAVDREALADWECERCGSMLKRTECWSRPGEPGEPPGYVVVHTCRGCGESGLY